MELPLYVHCVQLEKCMTLVILFMGKLQLN